MDDCCKAEDLARVAGQRDQRRVLVVVLAVNLALFVVEMVAGFLSHSTALLADSLDMLGDSIVYGFSLYVVTRSERARALAASLKGMIMLAFGALVLAEAARRMLVPALPEAHTMGMVGLLALAGNAFCFWLLYRHRSDGLNMRSTWLCSRNDLIANLSVLGAAAVVARTGSAWPDLVVGVSIAALFAQSGWGVLREAITAGRPVGS
jgi:cation diffusion facilitator family transporter